MAKPYARGLLVDRFMPNRVISRARADTRALTSVLAAMPYQISDVLEEFRDGEVEIGFRHQGIDELARNLDRITNRVDDRPGGRRRRGRVRDPRSAGKLRLV